jgi:adenylate kinase
MHIALLGPSGAGKGSHATKLATRFDLLHVVSGELFRANLEKRTAVGLLARRYLAQGELVPDEVTDAMMEEWLWQIAPRQGVLFDGFPRTVAQAQFLDELFPPMGRTLDVAIYLHVSDNEILRRLAGRLICHTCQTPYHLQLHPPAQSGICDRCGGELERRPDDIPELIRVRLRAFQRVSGPLFDYYQATGRFILVDGEGALEQVQAALEAALDAVRRQQVRPATRTETNQFQTGTVAVPALSAEQRAAGGLNLVLLGGPGSGKGTQAEELHAQFALTHIATGDLFREHLRAETDLGKLARAYMDRGELVPDDVTEAMVEERLTRPDTQAGFVLDGFPRTLPQAEALGDILAQLHRQLTSVLYINVADQEIVTRLGGRRICRSCHTPYHLTFKPPAQVGICDRCGGTLEQRDDDNPQTIRARLKTFHAQTAPLIHYYKAAGLLVEIDGRGEVAAVKERTVAAVGSLRHV